MTAVKEKFSSPLFISALVFLWNSENCQHHKYLRNVEYSYTLHKFQQGVWKETVHSNYLCSTTHLYCNTSEHVKCVPCMGIKCLLWEHPHSQRIAHKMRNFCMFCIWNFANRTNFGNKVHVGNEYWNLIKFLPSSKQSCFFSIVEGNNGFTRWFLHLFSYNHCIIWYFKSGACFFLGRKEGAILNLNSQWSLRKFSHMLQQVAKMLRHLVQKVHFPTSLDSKDVI